MSYSTQRAVSDGTLSSLTLSIQFYNRADISVFIGSVLQPVGTSWSWTGATGSTIKFKSLVPVGVEVTIKRVTDVSEIRHNFSGGAQFTSNTLDENFQQFLYVAQESQEGGRSITDVYGDIDMHGFKVRNLGVAVEPSSAAQLAQVIQGTEGSDPVIAIPNVNAVSINLQKYVIEGGRYSALGFIDKASHAALRANQYDLNVQAQLQNWIDACFSDNHGGFLPSGTYNMGVTNYINAAGAVDGITCLRLRNGLDIIGESQSAILRVLPHQYGPGAFFRALSSDVQLRNVALSNLTVDGNRYVQTTGRQCNNILFECKENVSLSRVKSLRANGPSIMLRGNYGDVASIISVDKCIVNDANDIGIQMSHVIASRITGSTVGATLDNGIDIYGENNGVVSDSINNIVAHNYVAQSSVGLFLETLSGVNAHDNHIAYCPIGIMTNRINGQPRGQNIHHNNLTACQTGFLGNGDGLGVHVHDNVFDGFSVAGCQIGAGRPGNSSYFEVTHNKFIPSGKAVPIIRLFTEQSAFNVAHSNTVILDGFDENMWCTVDVGSQVGNRIDGGTVLPNQVGPVLQGVKRGTFTPKLVGSVVAGEQTYLTARGDYTLIDRVVTFNCTVVAAAKGAGMDGDLRITGLPFVSRAGSGDQGASVNMSQYVTYAPGYTAPAAIIPQGQSYILLTQMGTNTAAATLKTANIGNNMGFSVSGSYTI